MTFSETDRHRLNRAYRCFGFLGFVTLPLGIALLLDMVGFTNLDQNSHGFGGNLLKWLEVATFVLGVPIFLGMLYATIYGTAQALRLRHPPLIFLSAVSIICLSVWLTVVASDWDNSRHPVAETVMSVLGTAYIAANLSVPAWWFTIGRRSP